MQPDTNHKLIVVIQNTHSKIRKLILYLWLHHRIFTDFLQLSNLLILPILPDSLFNPSLTLPRAASSSLPFFISKTQAIKNRRGGVATSHCQNDFSPTFKCLLALYCIISWYLVTSHFCLTCLN